MNTDRGSTPVQIRAQRDGRFVFILDPSMPFQMILRHLEKKHRSSNNFFKSASVVLDLGLRPFRVDEVKAIRDMLRKDWNAQIVELRLGHNLESFFDWVSQQLDIPIKQIPVEEQGLEPVIIRHTCRSGMRIEAPVDCIILGDVNPGAEVIAGRDIIIFGVLRGMAHAGAMGNRNAKIWALSIEPNQIRIADLVAVPPHGDRHAPKRYEVAEIRDDRIEVITY
ncbi:septum site-determining protein MinC [Thermodesulforhabdus norvegica]|uniref:Probable septum site-determining protein MinC n=1 Tax=Thermodesulforhabdus norvegica TaxID=39841 RepID=A0A1I4V857_9BACT|nr:septum site-determining protein MinC [Thermodesulforhabdus norvegica]SFM97396.1 septum site-determining protein MinC [Thermodesulforhabdus norvegica]